MEWTVWKYFCFTYLRYTYLRYNGKLKFISVNVRGLNTPEKRQKIFSWLRESKIDIILLQETHFIEKNESLYNLTWKGKTFHAYSDSTFSRGVSVLFSETVNVNVKNVRRCDDGRKILINLEIDGNAFTIVNIYAPNDIQKRCRFFKKLKTFISKHSLNENMVMCGDFNCQLNNAADKSVRYLQDVIRYSNMDDMWTKHYPGRLGYTWCDARNDPKSRIDYVFINNSFCCTLDDIMNRKPLGTHSKGSCMTDHINI